MSKVTLLAIAALFASLTLSGCGGGGAEENIPGSTASETTAPATPTGLAATAMSLSQINLSWTAATTAATNNIETTGYSVYRDGIQIATLGVVTTFQDIGLAPSTTYSYTIEAVGANGKKSGHSKPVPGRTKDAPDTTPPSTPTGLTATAASSSQINLSWTAATDNFGVTGYNVYRGGMQVATLGAVTTYQNNGLTASTTYSYTVRAFDAAGNVSASSSSASATTQAPAVDTTAPSTPAGLTAAAASSSQINLSWTAATDNVGVTGYNVYRGGLQITTLGAVTTFQNTGLTASTNYSYTVQAFDAEGNASGQSIAASATTVSPPVPTVSLAANPTSVASGASSTLTWSSTNAASCTASGAWTGSRATAGSESSAPLTASTNTFTLSCSGAGGSQSATATVTTGAPSTRTYTTNFDLTENPISEGGAWSSAGLDWTAVRTAGGIAYGTHQATGYNDSYAHLSGFAPDQSVEATIFKQGSFAMNQEVEIHLRWADSLHVARGYEILWQANNEYAEIVRWNGALGDFTVLAPISFPRPPVTGDVMKAQIVGNQITVYLNGTLVGSTSDSTWSDGNPGIGFFSRDPSGEQNSRFGFTSFTAKEVQR